MTIQLLRQYQAFIPGSIVNTFSRGVCDELIRRGVAKIVNVETVATKAQKKAKSK